MSVIKMTDLDLAGKRVFIRADSERTSKRRESNQRRAYPCFSADHRTGPETRRKSDGNFPTWVVLPKASTTKNSLCCRLLTT